MAYDAQLVKSTAYGGDYKRTEGSGINRTRITQGWRKIGRDVPTN
jgi:hypothetical protein